MNDLKTKELEAIKEFIAVESSIGAHTTYRAIFLGHFRHGKAILCCSVLVALFLHMIIFLFSFPHINRVGSKDNNIMLVSLINDAPPSTPAKSSNINFAPNYPIKTKQLGKNNAKSPKNTINHNETTTSSTGSDNRQTNSLVTVTNPKFVFFKVPNYPKRAIENAQEGLVGLNIVVSSNGKPVKIDVATSSGHEILDKAAIDAARLWVFEPIKHNNRETAFKAKVSYNFILKR